MKGRLKWYLAQCFRAYADQLDPPSPTVLDSLLPRFGAFTTTTTTAGTNATVTWERKP